MNSKEALERIIKSHHIAMAMLCEGRKDDETEKAIETIKQDLDKLIQENNSLRAFVDNLQFCRQREANKLEDLKKENASLRTKIKKLEKELEEANDYIWELTKWDYFL